MFNKLRRRLFWSAFLEGFCAVGSRPRVPKEYNYREESDVEKSWLAVGRYLNVALEEEKMIQSKMGI